MATQACCESFTDYTSSESTQPSLCEWDNSKAGVGTDYSPTSSAKCQPKAFVHTEGFCLDTTEKCACTSKYEAYFLPPYSNDLQCPHNGNCYLRAEDECEIHSQGGFLSSWAIPDNLMHEVYQWRWPSKYSYGSTSCHVVGGTKRMHFSSVDSYVAGTGECRGFSASLVAIVVQMGPPLEML